MPSMDAPEVEGVCPSVLMEDRPFVQKVIESRPKRHEVRYMKSIYDYEDFRYVVHYAFDNSMRRSWFLMKHFRTARVEAAKDIGAHLAIGIITLILILG